MEARGEIHDSEKKDTSMLNKLIRKYKGTVAIVGSALALAVAVLVGGNTGTQMAVFTVDLTSFTDAITGTALAITTALGPTITTALGIGGLILGGIMLWSVFRRLVKR